MRLSVTASLVALALVAAAGCSKKGAVDPSDATFCKSYEDNFLAQCRINKESGIEPGDSAAIKAARSACNHDLGADGTFNERCDARAAQFADMP
ncbi:MAG: hypothetical protein IT373_16530 [Polyangiaceae bacterium]|nr:hypothetical protein [Polyangiaceae bacterium]